MAGGPFALHMTCLICALDGVVTRAERVTEGAEDDGYECPQGHAFEVSFSRGLPKKPIWPPSEREVAAIEKMKPGE